MNGHLKELEERISYQSKNPSLFSQILTHSSYTNEHRLDHNCYNERLELLGDAVLEIVTSDFLYHKYESLSEGDLTKIRASTVCEPTLAHCARDIHLGDYLLLGKGEDATGGRCCNSVVSDTMEALMGAVYLGGGSANAKEFIHRFILNDIEHKQLFYDSRTILQEMVQSRQAAALSYEILREDGPDHNKSFEVCTKIGSEKIGCGVERTKKAVEQAAAYSGILKLKAEDVQQEDVWDPPAQKVNK